MEGYYNYISAKEVNYISFYCAIRGLAIYIILRYYTPKSYTSAIIIFHLEKRYFIRRDLNLKGEAIIKCIGYRFT